MHALYKMGFQCMNCIQWVYSACTVYNGFTVHALYKMGLQCMHSIKWAVSVISSDPPWKMHNGTHKSFVGKRFCNFQKKYIINCGFFTKLDCAFLQQKNV